MKTGTVCLHPRIAGTTHRVPRRTWMLLAAFVALLVAFTSRALVEPQTSPDVTPKAYRLLCKPWLDVR